MKSLIRIAEAETNILVTEEVYLVARLTACKEFIQQKLDPLINSNNLASQAQQLNHAFSEICEFAREIDDITLKAMSKILKFYVSLINSYPQLVHEAWEKERWGKNKRRMLE